MQIDHKQTYRFGMKNIFLCIKTYKLGNRYLYVTIHVFVYITSFVITALYCTDVISTYCPRV